MQFQQFPLSQPGQPGTGQQYSQWPPSAPPQSPQSPQSRFDQPLEPLPPQESFPTYTQPEQYQQLSQGHDGFTQHSIPAVPTQLPSQYTQPQQYQKAPQPSQRPTASNTSTRSFLIVLIVIIIIVVGVFYAGLHNGSQGSSTPHNAGMTEQQYKDSTTATTVANLDKDGNLDSGKDVDFTATILNFVKDDSGNTAGANVSDAATFTSIIQVIFPAGTDITQLNARDQIEVWGTDDGTSTGTNAFGATVHEVAISALYLTDQTTGYSTS